MDKTKAGKNMENDKKYYIIDPESGYAHEVTKEQHEKYLEVWEIVSPKVNNLKCVPLLYGTAGELNTDWETAFKEWRKGNHYGYINKENKQVIWPTKIDEDVEGQEGKSE